MGELKDKVMSDSSYPSDVDGMCRNDTPFEGGEKSMPESNPIPGADGSLPVHSVKKTS